MRNKNSVMVLYSLSQALKKARWTQKARRTTLSNNYKLPLPAKKQTLISTPLLTIDCEMSGLNPKLNHLLSMGWVEIRDGKIDLRSAFHALIHSEHPVGHSVEIHGLRDKQLAGAASAAPALSNLAKQLQGKVAVFHHAPIDLAFIQKASKTLFGCPIHFAYIDTMEIEKRRLSIQGKSAPLHLNACRSRYNLPPITQHNALFDARACAELLLAQCAYMGDLTSLTLRDLGIRCA